MNVKHTLTLCIATTLIFMGFSSNAEVAADSVIESAYSGSNDFMVASGSGSTCADATQDSLLNFKAKAASRATKCSAQGGTAEMDDTHSDTECLYVGETARPYLHNRWGHLSCEK